METVDEPVRTLALSRTGYQRVGVPESSWPACELWKAGMRARGSALRDPKPEQWDESIAGDIDGLMVIAHDDLDRARSDFRRLFAQEFDAGVSVLSVDIGSRIVDEYGASIEHFGYVDGISQPRFFTGEVERDLARNRTTGWDSGFAPSEVLVPCPSGSGFGSYMVFRKLEQNVRAFQTESRELGRRLGLPKDRWAEAGAQMVGRNLDGRPVHLETSIESAVPVENGFTFPAAYPTCPMSSHIRKMNPRDGRTRVRPLARRGMPYGTRPYHPRAGQPLEAYPETGVGLLFLAHAADLGDQFEALQVAANGRDIQGLGGSDPIIGNGEPNGQSWQQKNGGSCQMNAGGFVKLLGGEYFFAPSPGFLRSLGD